MKPPIPPHPKCLRDIMYALDGMHVVCIYILYIQSSVCICNICSSKIAHFERCIFVGELLMWKSSWIRRCFWTGRDVSWRSLRWPSVNIRPFCGLGKCTRPPTRAHLPLFNHCVTAPCRAKLSATRQHLGETHTHTHTWICLCTHAHVHTSRDALPINTNNHMSTATEEN